jgi:NTP pyrophosphatase (non-canonical NTP hydrolase)
MFAIGDQEWAGISKVIEECGEVLQVIGKLVAVHGEERHWNSKNLHQDLEDEIADLLAAITFARETNCLDGERFDQRVAKKLARFRAWHALGIENLLKLREAACVCCAQPFSANRPRVPMHEPICVACFEAGK